MKPQIKISIAPAPLEQVLTEEFEAEQRKLLALYSAAPELLDALKQIARLGNDGEVSAKMQYALADIARAAIAKAEGK